MEKSDRELLDAMIANAYRVLVGGNVDLHNPISVNTQARMALLYYLPEDQRETLLNDEYTQEQLYLYADYVSALYMFAHNKSQHVAELLAQIALKLVAHSPNDIIEGSTALDICLHHLEQCNVVLEKTEMTLLRSTFGFQSSMRRDLTNRQGRTLAEIQLFQNVAEIKLHIREMQQQILSTLQQSSGDGSDQRQRLYAQIVALFRNANEVLFADLDTLQRNFTARQERTSSGEEK